MVYVVMMDFTRLILVAILVKAIYENIKMIYDKYKLNPNMIGSLLVRQKLIDLILGNE